MNTQTDRTLEPGEDRRAFKLVTCGECNLDFWSSGPTMCAECRWLEGQRVTPAFAKLYANGRRD